MIFGRVIGWILFLTGVGIAGYEIISGLIAPAYKIVPLGLLWFKLDVGSLNLIQAGIQRNLWPWLWTDVIFHILRLPAWTVFAVPGLILIIWCRRQVAPARRGRMG